MSDKKFKHDCKQCRFMGHYRGHDVYYCKQTAIFEKGDETLLARHGDDGHEYWSIPKSLFLNIVREGLNTSSGRVSFREYIDGDGHESAIAAVSEALGV